MLILTMKAIQMLLKKNPCLNFVQGSVFYKGYSIFRKSLRLLVDSVSTQFTEMNVTG